MGRPRVSSVGPGGSSDRCERGRLGRGEEVRGRGDDSSGPERVGVTDRLGYSSSKNLWFSTQRFVPRFLLPDRVLVGLLVRVSVEFPVFVSPGGVVVYLHL